MVTRNGPVHVVTTSRRYKGKLYQTHLLRRSYREGGQVRNETVGNLSHLPDHVIDLIRGALRGEVYAPVESLFEVISSPHHGHVQAVRSTMKRLGFENLLASRSSRPRDLVVAMVVARILEPHSKLATTRWWHTTTLAEDLGVTDATEGELYGAMDWLLEHQQTIEKKLARRHLHPGELALFDLSSSYFEGVHCPLAALGHNRDGKKGWLQVNYGLLTDVGGCPVSVSVYPGNTGDTTTLLPEVRKIREEFGLAKLVMVGDRGMISQKQILQMKDLEDLAWITALKTGQIRKLMEGGAIQLGLFDERNLLEISHPDYPGERLVVCRNALMAERRVRTRQSLLEATEKELRKVQGMVGHGRLKGKAKIGLRVGKVVNKYRVAKHFELEIREDGFDFHISEAKVAAEAALDGLYVIRTNVPSEQLDSADTVRSYKLLSNVERAFRCLKTVDLKVRPIHHHLEGRVRAHIFLCMLAYYVEWHMLAAWRELLFADEDQEAKRTRDPVAPAERSSKALRKVSRHKLEDGTEAHSFRTLLEDLRTIVRNTCRRRQGAKEEGTFQITTTPNPRQQRALDLLEGIGV
jgi:transposase